MQQDKVLRGGGENGGAGRPGGAGGGGARTSGVGGASAATAAAMPTLSDFHGKNVSEDLLRAVEIRPPSAATILGAGRLAAGRRRLMAATAASSAISAAGHRGGSAGSVRGNCVVAERKSTAAAEKPAVPHTHPRPPHQHHQHHQHQSSVPSARSATDAKAGDTKNRNIKVKKKNIKVEAMEAARPILSAFAKAAPISKDKYKAVLRRAVQHVCRNGALLQDADALRKVIRAELTAPTAPS